MTQHPQPHFLEGKLEPECRDVQTPMDCATLSIAISLKRIADFLAGSEHRCDAIAYMANEIGMIERRFSK
jgi:hypothetical protein